MVSSSAMKKRLRMSRSIARRHAGSDMSWPIRRGRHARRCGGGRRGVARMGCDFGMRLTQGVVVMRLMAHAGHGSRVVMMVFHGEQFLAAAERRQRRGVAFSHARSWPNAARSSDVPRGTSDNSIYPYGV